MSSGETESQEHIDNLLRSAQLESGKIRLDLQAVHLPHLVTDAIEQTQTLASARGISVRSTVDAFGGTVLGDTTHLRHMLQNVLNAVIRSAPGDAEIDVALSRDDVRAEIRILDTGDRTRPSSAAGPPAPRTPSAGTEDDVLGLDVARQLAELHGGTLDITGAGSGLGVSATVRLPLIAIALEEPASIAAKSRPCDGLRILVVDDEPDARALIGAVLTHYGATVDVAESALMATAALARDTYDVLVSDIAMPKDDGFMLLEQVRRGQTPNRDVPAVALTAHASDDTRDRALDAGFAAYVTKPVTPAALVNVVAALGKPANRRDVPATDVRTETRNHGITE